MQSDESRLLTEIPAHDAARDALCSVVIVCFHSGAKLRGCLDNVLGRQASGSAGIEAVVVNNSASDEAEIAAICATYGAVFVQNPANLGYGYGCNAGAAKAGGDLLMFLNPDVRITPGDVSELVALFGQTPDLVALGPMQQSPSGRIRSKRCAVGQTKRADRTDSSAALMETGFLSGGALMVRRDAFDRIGGFDDAIFLFHEDDDLCLRLAKLGRLAYARHVVVQHDWGGSTPPSPEVTRARLWHQGYSKVQVLRKHYGDKAVRTALFEAMLKFASPEMLTSRGRRKARAFMGGVVAGLRQSGPLNGYVPA